MSVSELPQVTELPQVPFARDDLLAMPPAYRDILETGRVVRVRTPKGDPAWLVGRYDQVRELCSGDLLVRSHPDGRNAPRYSVDVFAAPVGDHRTYHHDHARVRRVLTAAFNSKRIRAFLPRVESIVDEVIDRFEVMEQPSDFREHVALQVPVTLITELLGVPAELRDDMRRWSDAAQNTVDQDRALQALIAIDKCFVDLVARKRADPAEDILSELILAHDEEGKLTDKELIALSHTLLFSGFTSAVARIEYGTLLLLNHPEQLAALRADPGLAPKVVEEVLRIAMPSFGGVPRWARADVMVGDQLIRAGELVLLGLEMAGHDPRVFPDPERFDIHRTGPAHLAFSHGSYYCIGAVLSRLELQAVFGRLFQRLPGLRLAVDPGELRLRTESLIGGFQALPMTW